MKNPLTSLILRESNGIVCLSIYHSFVLQLSDSSLSVKLHELLLSDIPGRVRVALGDKLLKFVIGHRKLQVVGKHTLQIVHCNVALVALVEQLEALARFIVPRRLVPP